MIIPFTPLALSSGNNTDKIVANTIIEINHDFSYVVNCLENNIIIATDNIKINVALAKLKIDNVSSAIISL